MMPTPIRRTLRAAVMALAGLVSFSVAAADANGTASPSGPAGGVTPIVVAQNSAATPGSPRLVVRDGAFPAYQRGVREAAREGPEALRRYIWRTRMIYDYYFPDFVED